MTYLVRRSAMAGGLNGKSEAAAKIGGLLISSESVSQQGRQ